MRLASIVPRELRKRRWERKTTRSYAASLLAGREPEAALLPELCDRNRVSIDVGAYLGAYTQLLRGLSSRVLAYEANPDMAARLRRVFMLARSVEIRNAALSDQRGVAALRIPADAGRSTIHPGNTLGQRAATAIQVDTRRLDDEPTGDVGFIKIDVEGHELAALQGAETLLRRCRPNLLIEADDEHRTGALASVRAFLEPLGYRAYVVEDGQMLPLSASSRPSYNFIFCP